MSSVPWDRRRGRHLPGGDLARLQRGRAAPSRDRPGHFCPAFPEASQHPMTWIPFHGEFKSSSGDSCSSSVTGSGSSEGSYLCGSSTSSYVPSTGGSNSKRQSQPGCVRPWRRAETGAHAETEPGARSTGRAAGAAAKRRRHGHPSVVDGHVPASEFESDRRDRRAAAGSGRPGSGAERRRRGRDRAPGPPSAVTVDAIVEGVHFSLPAFSPEAVGRKPSPRRSPTWPRWIRPPGRRMWSWGPQRTPPTNCFSGSPTASQRSRHERASPSLGETSSRLLP